MHFLADLQQNYVWLIQTVVVDFTALPRWLLVLIVVVARSRARHMAHRTADCRKEHTEYEDATEFASRDLGVERHFGLAVTEVCALPRYPRV